MSLDRSLRLQSTLVRHKNVLNRTERLARMQEQERWTEDSRILGMPKVGNRKAKATAKKKAKGPEEAAAATPAAAGAPPAAAASKAK